MAIITIIAIIIVTLHVLLVATENKQKSWRHDSGYQDSTLFSFFFFDKREKHD